MDVGGGELLIEGNAKATIEQYVNNGWISLSSALHLQFAEDALHKRKGL